MSLFDDEGENRYHPRQSRKKRRRNAGLIFLFWVVGALVIAAVLYSANRAGPAHNRPVVLPGQNSPGPDRK